MAKLILAGLTLLVVVAAAVSEAADKCEQWTERCNGDKLEFCETKGGANGTWVDKKDCSDEGGCEMKGVAAQCKEPARKKRQNIKRGEDEDDIDDDNPYRRKRQNIDGGEGGGSGDDMLGKRRKRRDAEYAAFTTRKGQSGPEDTATIATFMAEKRQSNDSQGMNNSGNFTGGSGQTSGMGGTFMAGNGGAGGMGGSGMGPMGPGGMGPGGPVMGPRGGGMRQKRQNYGGDEGRKKRQNDRKKRQNKLEDMKNKNENGFNEFDIFSDDDDDSRDKRQNV